VNKSGFRRRKNRCGEGGSVSWRKRQPGMGTVARDREFSDESGGVVGGGAMPGGHAGAAMARGWGGTVWSRAWEWRCQVGREQQSSAEFLHKGKE
jgi:hypothetical protein